MLTCYDTTYVCLIIKTESRILIKKQNKLNWNDSWIDELFQWADDNNIPELQYIQDDIMCDEGFWIGLPRDRKVLVNLEELDLSWHSCKEIPEHIRHLKNLKTFSFSKERDGLQPPHSEHLKGCGGIEEIPDWIAELENLEELNLSNNNISYVPNAIGKLKNLKKLYLHNNMIMLVDDELASLCKLEVLWIHENMFSVLANSINNLKELAHFDVDWEQQNKVSLLSDCLDQIVLQEWTDEKLSRVDSGRLNAVTHGLEQLRELNCLIGIEALWNEWSKLNNLKYKLKNLKKLRELYCDGLEYPSGPIKLCPEGLIVTPKIAPDFPPKMELKAEDYVEILLENTPAFFIKSDAFEVIIELNEHHGKSLMEKIYFMELWK